MADNLKAIVGVMFQNILHWTLHSVFTLGLLCHNAKFYHYAIRRTYFLMTTVSISIDPIAPRLPVCQIFSTK